jgi:predicted transcriptional regulator
MKTKRTVRKSDKRNTASSLETRNTSAPAPMRASKQLDAFPTSDNAKARQSHYRKAVVSIRLSGATIAKLDDEAKRATRDQDYRGGGWYAWRKVTRSDVIERAIGAWLDGAAKGGAS